MKKLIVMSMLFIIIGITIGLKLSTSTQSLENVFQTGTVYYFIQENVYTNKEIMEENTKEIQIKLIDYENEKYHVYLGITKDIENAKKLKKIYKNKGYDVYIKEKNLSNETFRANLTQFDLLLKNTNDEKELLTITEVILANFEEIIQKSP